MDPWTAWLHASALSGWNHDLDGYIASGLVLATFSMKSMRGLRLTAIASNVAFIFYALVAGLHPILVLHVTLLPLNIIRLTQTELTAAASKHAHHSAGFTSTAASTGSRNG